MVHVIRLAAIKKNVAILCNFIEETLIPLDVERGDILDISLAADEAFSNIIFHGEAAFCPLSVKVRITIPDTGDRIRLDITDTGKAFQMGPVVKPDVEERLEGKTSGGIGLYLIHSVMDSVRYGRRHGINYFSAVKMLSTIATRNRIALSGLLCSG